MVLLKALPIITALSPVLALPLSEPVKVEVPCVTTRGADPASATLQGSAFKELLKERGLDELRVKQHIIRAEVYRFVDLWGEAICTVELTPR